MIKNYNNFLDNNKVNEKLETTDFDNSLSKIKDNCGKTINNIKVKYHNEYTMDGQPITPGKEYYAIFKLNCSIPTLPTTLSSGDTSKIKEIDNKLFWCKIKLGEKVEGHNEELYLFDIIDYIFENKDEYVSLLSKIKKTNVLLDKTFNTKDNFMSSINTDLSNNMIYGYYLYNIPITIKKPDGTLIPNK